MLIILGPYFTNIYCIHASISLKLLKYSYKNFGGNLNSTMQWIKCKILEPCYGHKRAMFGPPPLYHCLYFYVMIISLIKRSYRGIRTFPCNIEIIWQCSCCVLAILEPQSLFFFHIYFPTCLKWFIQFILNKYIFFNSLDHNGAMLMSY